MQFTNEMTALDVNQNDLSDSQLKNIDDQSDAECSLIMAEENSLDLDTRNSNIGKIITNNMNNQNKNINFYGSHKSTEMQDFDDSAGKSLKQSQDFENDNQMYLLNI